MIAAAQGSIGRSVLQVALLRSVAMSASHLQRPAIADMIWNLKYRLRDASGDFVDRNVEDTLERVAKAAAGGEPGGKQARKRARQAFLDAIGDFGFLPAGRIIAGAGAGRDVTLFNCFVMDQIEDDLGGIFERVKEAARTMQSGGGIGQDFSTLRPRGSLVKSIGADASGPISFMDVWDAMCGTIMSAGARRGAMMGTLRADHPDIEAFIAAKSDPDRLRNFNLSVLVSDRLIEAVRADGSWNLQFDGKVYRTMRARALWDKLMQATYDYAEPGVIFIDRINARNNLSYCEEIYATNPCGEQPLPPNGACLLGSINLAALVRKPFSPRASIDAAVLEARVRTAVRFLDNLIDVSKYPLRAQKQEALAKRRMGLGVTGLADALIFCGLRYDSEEGVRQAEKWMMTIQHAAYQASAELAAERSSFPLFDRSKFLDAPNVAALPKAIRKDIKRHGIRNGCLTSIAPTGTISLFAGNVSSGIEPVFAFVHNRRLLDAHGRSGSERVEDYAHRVFRESHGGDAPLPDTFVDAGSLSPRAHLNMQAALQAHVDSSISKTINCPQDIAFDAFKDVYLEAYDLGLKGCTTYRPNEVTGAVLSVDGDQKAAPGRGDEPGPVAANVVDGEDRDAGMQTRLPEGVAVGAHEGALPAYGPDADIVYMSRPLERDATLSGYTYKIKWPTSDHALYVTINDIEHNGRRRPFEIFINTRNLEHYAWTVALTRMISAVFRRGGDVSFVAEELKVIFDPQGGNWVAGRYVPSLLAAIGETIEEHMRRIGFLGEAGGASDGGENPERLDEERGLRQATAGHSSERPVQPSTREITAPGGSRADSEALLPAARSSPDVPMSGEAQQRVLLCRRCSSPNTVRQEGCQVCLACGFSRCG